MHKQTVVGTLIRADDTRLVMQEDDGTIATYSRQYYRLPMDRVTLGEPLARVRKDKMPVDLQYGHEVAILVPS